MTSSLLQVIITMEDGSSIQNVIDLSDLNEQLIDIHGQPITIKTEIIEPLESTTSTHDAVTTTTAAAAAVTTKTMDPDETMASVAPAEASEVTSEPSKEAEASKEVTPGKKRRSFKTKVLKFSRIM